MPHLPDSQHPDHDLELIAAYAAGDATGPELERATALVAACEDCAALHHDLRSIAAAMPTMPAPARTRDFRLTPEQAAELRPKGLRGLLATLSGPQVLVRDPGRHRARRPGHRRRPRRLRRAARGQRRHGRPAARDAPSPRTTSRPPAQPARRSRPRHPRPTRSSPRLPRHPPPRRPRPRRHRPSPPNRPALTPRVAAKSRSRRNRLPPRPRHLPRRARSCTCPPIRPATRRARPASRSIPPSRRTRSRPSPRRRRPPSPRPPGCPPRCSRWPSASCSSLVRWGARRLA